MLGYEEMVKKDIERTTEIYVSLSNYETDNIHVASLVSIHCFDLEKRLEWLNKELTK